MSTPSHPTIHLATALAARSFPPQRWLVEQLLPEGLTLLVGKPKMGKSWLALHMALQIARGERVLAHYPTRQARVLYFALEDGERRLQARQALLLGARAPSELLGFAYDLPPLDHTGRGVLASAIAAHGAQLVVVDTMGRVQPSPPGGGSPSYDRDYKFTSALQRLTRELGIALLLVHHERKSVEGGSDYTLDKVLGTTGITAGADSIMLVQPEGGANEDERRLHLTGRDVEPIDFTYLADLQQGTFHLTGGRRLSAGQRRILGQFRTGSALSARELATRLGVSTQVVHKHLHVLVREGRLRQHSTQPGGPEGGQAPATYELASGLPTP